jgi:rsbT co-antagonist protein RsbR
MTLSLSSQNALSNSKQVARLKQSLTWMIIVAAPFGLFEAITSAVFGIVNLALIGAMTLVFAGWAFYIRSNVDRVSLSRAASLLCAGILAIILVTASILPFVWPTMVVAVFMAIALALPYLDDRPLRRLLIIATLVGALITLLGWAAPFQEIFPTPPPMVVEVLIILPTIVASLLTVLLLWQFRKRLGETLAETQVANAALREAQAGLETQVTERTAALHTAMADIKSRADTQAQLLLELEEQRTTIRELSVPVIPINASTLVMPLIGALDTARLRQLRERALHAITRARARYLVLDITGVSVIDSQIAQGIIATVQATRLLGTEALLVGVRPEVAQAIVALGVDLHAMRAFADLQAALDHIAIQGQQRFPVAPGVPRANAKIEN